MERRQAKNCLCLSTSMAVREILFPTPSHDYQWRCIGVLGPYLFRRLIEILTVICH